MVLFFWANNVKGHQAKQDCKGVCHRYKAIEKETGQEYEFINGKYKLK